MIVDTLEHWKRYSDSPLWRRAFEHLLWLDADAADTEMTPLEGEDLMARVMTYPTRPVADAVLEAHDRYVDIQMSISGGERIDWFPRAALAVETPYDPDSDAVFFERPGIAPVSIPNLPGRFAVFFPEDAHSPQLALDDTCALVKKVVVKVRLAALFT